MCYYLYSHADLFFCERICKFYYWNYFNLIFVSRLRGQDVGSCCLFLAGKVEDSPKKLKDIIIKSTSFSSGVELKETDDV
jgi:hypothetical protein